MGVEGDATVAQAVVSAEAPVTQRVALSTWLGASRSPLGDIGLLDATLTAPVVVAEGGTWLARVGPGLSLPIGTLGNSGVATIRSSGSPDPMLTAEAAGGGTVVGMGRAMVRVPLVDGRDGVQDGPFVRLDAAAGTRVGRFVPLLGTSWLQQAPDAVDGRGYTELSVLAGTTINLSTTWGLDVQARVPVAGSGAPVAGVLRATHVVGKAKKGR